MVNRWTNWLEQKWVAPAYAGWVSIAISICFFGAATNTLTGWLYVLSAMGIVLAILAAILPMKSLQALSIEHLPIAPITHGEDLHIQLQLFNHSQQPQRLFQVIDHWPLPLGAVSPLAIEQVPAQGSYIATLTCTPNHRGVYRWDQLDLRSGQPVGLFWCRRSRRSPAQVYVYPRHLRLRHCPILDNWCQSVASSEVAVNRRPQPAVEGTTRSLRPYRTGDPLRLVHWRSSARFGQFQVRELEVVHHSQTITICLDASGNWAAADFEQAVVATCTLYHYARQRQLAVQIWTSHHGKIVGHQAVLQALAEINVMAGSVQIPTEPVVWIGNRTMSLPLGSRYLLWGQSQSPGIQINPDRPLLGQLQQSIYQ